MSDIYIQKQQELDSYIDELNIIPSKYNEYKEKANDMIDYLLSCIEIKNKQIDKLKNYGTHYKLLKEEYEEQSKEIMRLNNIINEVQNIIFNNAFKFDKWVENENGKCILSQSNYAIKDLSGNKVREIWDLLNKS